MRKMAMCGSQHRMSLRTTCARQGDDPTHNSTETSYSITSNKTRIELEAPVHNRGASSDARERKAPKHKQSHAPVEPKGYANPGVEQRVRKQEGAAMRLVVPIGQEMHARPPGEKVPGEQGEQEEEEEGKYPARARKRV